MWVAEAKTLDPSPEVPETPRVLVSEQEAGVQRHSQGWSLMLFGDVGAQEMSQPLYQISPTLRCNSVLNFTTHACRKAVKGVASPFRFELIIRTPSGWAVLKHIPPALPQGAFAELWLGNLQQRTK